jgi:aspartokinase
MIKETARIIVNSKKDSEIVVVVSAMTQITNQLIEIYNLTLV